MAKLTLIVLTPSEYLAFVRKCHTELLPKFKVFNHDSRIIHYIRVGTPPVRKTSRCTFTTSEWNSGWSFQETLLHELLAELDVSCNTPEVGRTIGQNTSAVRETAGYSLDGNALDSSFFISVEELNLFKDWARVSALVTQSEGASVTARKQSLKVCPC